MKDEYNDINKKIGLRIKSLRQKKGLTQEQLANLIGSKYRSTIMRYENGERTFKQSQIMKFANALDVDPGYLVDLDYRKLGVISQTNDYDIFEEKLIKITNDSKDAQRFIQCFKNLNNEGFKELVKYAEYLTTDSKYNSEFILTDEDHKLFLEGLNSNIEDDPVYKRKVDEKNVKQKK